MFKRMLRSLAHSAGYRIQRVRPDSIEIIDYPVRSGPRWGYGRPPHPALAALLAGGRTDFASLLRSFFLHRSVLHAIPYAPDLEAPTRPYWQNGYFSTLDAASLVALTLSRGPARYVEIGSGHSTQFARYAVDTGRLATKLVSIDPQPRAEIDVLCDAVIRERLEDCDLGIFSELRAGDLLFFDSSHRIFANSDVTTFFFDILPHLEPGILVHFHDIFWPSDYPPAWMNRYYSEQYLLGAMLLCGQPPLRPVLPNFFVCHDDELASIVIELFSGQDGGLTIPFYYPEPAGELTGVSFWAETI